MIILLMSLFHENSVRKRGQPYHKKEGENREEKSRKRGNRVQNRIKMRKNSYREAYMINFSYPLKKKHYTSEDFFTSTIGIVTYL